MDFSPFIPELTELLRALCRIPAPSHGEDARARFCKEWFVSAGFSHVFVDEAKNVVCSVDGERDGEAVVFMAHTDTVFPDQTPFELTERGGKWFCPGIGDDTANLAILMMAAKILHQQGRRPKHPLLFVADSCEEGLGNLKGCRTLMERYGDRVKEVISFDLSYDKIYVKAVGSARYRISVRTEGGHSYGDFGNRNAIHQLSRLICDLYGQPIPSEPDSKTTVNVGTVRGGTSVNTIAQDAEILYEYRSDSNACLEIMKNQLEDILSKYRAEGIALSCESIGQRPGMGICRDPESQADLIRRAEACIKDAVGSFPERQSASTDCNIPFSMGIPSVCFGLVSSGGAHTREEWLDPESLPRGLAIALDFIGGYYL